METQLALGWPYLPLNSPRRSGIRVVLTKRPWRFLAPCSTTNSGADNCSPARPEWLRRPIGGRPKWSMRCPRAIASGDTAPRRAAQRISWPQPPPGRVHVALRGSPTATTLTRTQGCQLCSGTAHLQLTGGARVSEEPRHCGAGIQDFSITKIRFATDSKALATMSKVSLAGWVVSPERVSSIVQTSGEAPIPRGSSGQAYLLERGEATAGCGGKAGNCNIPGGVIRAGRLARQLMAKCEAA